MDKRMEMMDSRMKKPKFSLLRHDQEMQKLVEMCDKVTLAHWAIACTNRVIHFYEVDYPDDDRPHQALQTLQAWIETGKFSMKVIRCAALASHAAAREVGEDTPARSAARAAGQAVSTAHVAAHALGAANYALQAIHRSASAEEAENAVANERDWQYHMLQTLYRKSKQNQPPH